jgi:phosphomannomutase
MKPVVLFDMDGTLTEPRKTVEAPMLRALETLMQYAVVGIVSGSDYDYIYQQMELDKNDLKDVLIYPCNGTKRYVYDQVKKRWENTFSVDMKEEIGGEKLYSLMELLLDWQLFYLESAKKNGFKTPLTGLHLQNRGSMINWCPIGRGADHDERKLFQDYDANTSWREETLPLLEDEIGLRVEGVTVVKGGSTSFDIYPDGWDKRFVKRFHEGQELYFVGDRCEKGGNDYELYADLKRSKESRTFERKQLFFPWSKVNQDECKYQDSFNTGSPEETSRIIEEDLIPRIVKARV